MPISSKGLLYRCPVCGAEVAVLADSHGDFRPRCCNTDMVPTWQRLIFYVCPVCHAEIAVFVQPHENFIPRCCNTPMIRQPAA